MKRLSLLFSRAIAAIRNNRSYAAWEKRQAPVEEKPIALFDTAGLTVNRRIRQVELQLIDAGYTIRILPSKASFLSTGNEPYGVAFWQNGFCAKDEPVSLVVCGKDNRNYPGQKKLVFCDDIADFPQHMEEPFFFPLHLHVIRMEAHQEAFVKQLPREQKIGAVFIGSTAPASYKPFESYIHNTFHLPSRLEVLDHIRKTFPESVFEPETAEEFWQAFDDPFHPLKNKIVLIDKPHIGGEDYMRILRNSAFHLWTCGDQFPYCHNQPEGMLCGAVPILQEYPLYAGLKNSENCLIFSELLGLDEILEKIISGGHADEEIERMSQNIQALYEKHFGEAAFEQKLAAFLKSEKEEEPYYIHPAIYRRRASE